MTEFVTPHLRSVLKTYQDSATKSLQGPGSSLAVHPSAMKKEIQSPDLRDESIIPPPPPLQPPEISQPILSSADTGRGTLYETILEGKPIGCFLLGGEMRLCFPQVLNNVLMDFGLDQINRIFDDLRIFCSQCSPEQLSQFKAAKILPEDVNTSGLITRTNAERLCSALLHRPDRPRIAKNAISFRVVHRCFGKCDGICTPELYSYKDPACIRCIECNGMFSPSKFVCHVHQRQENSTLHWGFDSNNWRAYLQVPMDEENREKYVTYLDDLREREQQDLLHMQSMQRDVVSHLKRKADVEDSLPRTPCKKEPLDIPLKKPKFIDEKSLFEYHQYQMLLAQYQRHQYHGFRPWTQLVAPPLPTSSTTGSSNPSKHLPHLSYAVAAAAVALPYLSQEPPVLQNPERVVRISECERYEQSYQPNVALAPRGGGSKTVNMTSSTTSVVDSKIGLAQQNDYESGDRDASDHTLAMDVKIKQERPQTPSDESQSPESRMDSPLLPPASSAVHPAPISPEGQSASSNEITSSTSPVPATTTTNTFDKLTHSTIHSPKTTTPPPVANHHINQIMLRSHQKVKSTTNLPKDINHRAQHMTLQNGIIDHNRHKLNGLNSEFELSTDTDDDSLIGEADSSNNMAPFDLAVEALKDTPQQDREKVLNIIKILLHENLQISIKNAKLVQELHRKDDEIADLVQINRRVLNTNTNYNCSRSSSTSSNDSIMEKNKIEKYDNCNLKTTETENIHSKQNDQEKMLDTIGCCKSGDNTTIRSLELSASVKLEKTVSITEINSNPKSEVAVAITMTKHIPTSAIATVIEVGTGGPATVSDTTNATSNGTGAAKSTKTGAKCETEVIRMPLKKSIRRSPEETSVVIMQPHKLRDEARDRSCDKLDKLSRSFENTIRSLSPSPINHQKNNNLVVAAKANDVKICAD